MVLALQSNNGPWNSVARLYILGKLLAESEIVMGDGTFLDHSFDQDRSWDESGTTISGG